MIKFLIALRDLMLMFKQGLERLVKETDKSKVREAINESTEKSTQEPLEKNVSGVSGRPTKHKYSGMRTQKAKKRD